MKKNFGLWIGVIMLFIFFTQKDLIFQTLNLNPSNNLIFLLFLVVIILMSVLTLKIF